MIADQLFKSYEHVFDLYDQVGVYAYNSFHTAEADANKLCYVFGERHPECLRAKKPVGFKQAISVKTQAHLQQNMIEGRFQEYSDTYAPYDEKDKKKGVRQTD